MARRRLDTPLVVREVILVEDARVDDVEQQRGGNVHGEVPDVVLAVHPDRKLMVATSAAPTASMTGLMMPPPIPQMTPMVEAKNAMANTIASI